MNKRFSIVLSFFLSSLFCFQLSAQTGTQKADEFWSRIKLDPTNIIPPDPNYKYVQNPQTQVYKSKNIEAIVSPNYRIKPTTNTTQSELSIDIHPTNPNILFAGANATPWPVSGIYGTGVYWSTDGGNNWAGFDNPPAGSNSGDPAAVIGTNGNFYMGYISDPGGMGVDRSTNGGTNWTRYTVSSSTNDDKNHLMVDKKVGSPYENRVYNAWTDFNTSASSSIAFSYSTDNGTTWSAKNFVTQSMATYLDQGVNVQTGPNGEVYMAFAIYDGTSITGGEDAIGFAKSTNGGVTWTTARVYGALTPNGSFNFGIRGNLKPTSIRVSSFPSMAVDRSGGINNGYIYIVWPQRNVAPAGTDPDIVMIKSTDGGSTWSTPVRVNDDPLSNGKDQYYPWCTVDQITGRLNVVFYDNRHTTSDSTGVWMATSGNAGLSFENFKVSDANFRPKPISGLASGYQGDYIGITSANDKAFPFWAEDRTGNYQAWIAQVTLTTFPLNPFNINTPAAGVTINSYPNGTTPYTITWDTASLTASYKWIFGSPTTNPRLLTVNSSSNSLTLTSGQLDALLASIGLLPGDSLVGQWDVWAFRNNAPAFDSLKSTNGPRAITLKRGIPPLVPFSLLNPINNSRIVTSVFNNGPVNINWRKSGDGVTYRWKFGTNILTNPTLNYPSNNSGFDTTLNFINSGLDLILGGMGLAPGDSIVGQWAVWAYNGLDSLKSAETFGLTLKRQAKGDYLIAYDSTNTACRASKDSVSGYLNSQAITFDLFNRGSQTSTNVMTFRGYKAILWLGEGTSVMSVIQKDSIKAYLNNPVPGQKSKLIIYSEDIGYQFGRSASSYYDLAFMNQFLGANYVLDRPSSGGNQGLVGVYINTGQTDSTVVNWPDVLSRFDPSTTYDLYKFRADNSINAVGKIVPLYNVATFGVDLESLRRANDSPSGSSINRLLKGGIDFVNEVTALKTLNLKMLVQGFFNGTTMTTDTVNIELRSTISPYALLETKKALLNNTGSGTASFSTVADGTPFYIVLKHRNSLETWSATGKSFTSGSLSYDFSDDSAKAFGFNMIKKGTKWCIYSGDVDQDGFIDGSDFISIANNWEATGLAMAGDVNGDQFIDGSDYVDIVNNWERSSIKPLIQMITTPSSPVNDDQVEKKE